MVMLAHQNLKTKFTAADIEAFSVATSIVQTRILERRQVIRTEILRDVFSEEISNPTYRTGKLKDCRDGALENVCHFGARKIRPKERWYMRQTLELKKCFKLS